MEYSTLVNLVEKHALKNEMDVVYFLVGYKGAVDKADLDNMKRLYADGFISR